MSNVKTENPVPPTVPQVSRETGAVKITRPEDQRTGVVDDWAYSENPWEGGLNGALNFNDAMPAKDRAKAVAEFNQKPSNRVI